MFHWFMNIPLTLLQSRRHCFQSKFAIMSKERKKCEKLPIQAEYSMSHLSTCKMSANYYPVTHCHTAISSIGFNIVMNSFSAFQNFQRAPYFQEFSP